MTGGHWMIKIKNFNRQLRVCVLHGAGSISTRSQHNQTKNETEMEKKDEFRHEY